MHLIGEESIHISNFHICDSLALPNMGIHLGLTLHKVVNTFSLIYNDKTEAYRKERPCGRSDSKSEELGLPPVNRFHTMFITSVQCSLKVPGSATKMNPTLVPVKPPPTCLFSGSCEFT